MEEAKIAGTFYQRLMNGNHPPWLIPVALPEQLQDVYLVYEIQFDQGVAVCSCCN